TFQDFEIIVIDNASSDDSVDMVETQFPEVKLIHSGGNVGLCAGNNLGILATEAEFILILNNDTELEPEFIGELVKAMETDPTIGMCASKMLLTDQRDMIESAGIVVDRSGIAWGLESGDLKSTKREPFRPVFGACGGAALYRREMLLEIGLFDEDFFVYLEDADIAWRGQWAGWQCVYVPTAVVYHAHSATIKEGSPFKTRLLARNKLWMIVKNYPWPHLIWYSPLILFYELMAIGYGVVSGRGGYTFKGRFEGLRQLPKILAKRRQMVRRTSSTEMMKRLNKIENPLTLFRRYLNISEAATSGRFVSKK
ncbi:MAG: glycosyltransferase family 2 protein, partial [Chloroflexota bacterium]